MYQILMRTQPSCRTHCACTHVWWQVWCAELQQGWWDQRGSHAHRVYIHTIKAQLAADDRCPARIPMHAP